MTLHKLSAGTGYEYLTNQVAALDSTEKGATPLADYYAAKGESPGRWVGSGLVGIDGIQAGDLVSAEQMGHLFGTGSHPSTGATLGSPYKTYGNEGIDGFNAEVSRRIAAAERPRNDVIARIRSEVARGWFVREHDREPSSKRELSAALARYSRPRQTSVAGYDLTFSPVKSVSTMWAVAPPEVSKLIEQAHDAAIADALAYLEREVIFTREGTNGARQVETRGLIATAFKHRDSRAGDPDLHTHVAVSNKVQTREGKWLSIYGRVLHQHVVAASETYNTALEHHLHALLGVRFADREVGVPPTGTTMRGREKRAVREIVGVDRALCQRWSARRGDIVKRQRELAREFTRAQGRPPTPVEAVALAQQANLETRETKHEPRSEAEQREVWLREAGQALGWQTTLDRMVDAALHPAVPAQSAISSEWVKAMAVLVLGELEAHQATWQSWHVYAEAQRQVRDVAVPPERVSEVVQWVVDATDALFVNLTPERDPIEEPNALRRSDDTSVYRHTGRDHFTSARVLDAEERLVAAAGMNGAFCFDPEEVEITIRQSAIEGDRLNRGQRELVMAMSCSDSRLRLGLAPAGSGKTTAMKVLAQVWTDRGYDAIGLTPAAAAAAVLTDAAEIFSETLAKLDHQITTHRFEGWAAGIGPHTLIVIDEAGMADTLTLDRVVGYCLARGATVRLIGDDQQLAAIGAGGVLRDIAHQHGVDRLDEVVRFADPAEAAASLDLREGDPTALGFYLDNDRVHVGDTATCVDTVFDSWSRETADGRDCLMLAPTRELVAELNARARAVRLNGKKPRTEVPLRDGNHASLGDTIISRHNERHLGVSGTDWVKNGDRWTVTSVRAGALTVKHTGSGLTTTLPAEYVASHVDLGYASTVHTAQGLTADAMHGIVTGEESRQLLYTMLTRGRSENHAHVVLAFPTDPHHVALPGLGDQLTATEVLEGVLARDGAAVSATSTATVAAGFEAQLHDAVVRYVDAVEVGSSKVLGSRADDALWATAGPLPWLPGMPTDVAAHVTWGPYLEARAQRVRSLASAVSSRSQETLPTWAAQFADVLDGPLYGEVLLWRAASGLPDDDRRLTGPPPTTDSAAAYARNLTMRINQRYTDIVRGWEAKVVEYVGYRDEQTLLLARDLDRLARSGHDAEQLLDRSASHKPLPDDHASSALAYRIRDQLSPKRAARGLETPPYRPAPSQRPGLGL